tara:strand:+ start:299 stop:925 length:627 start_codon:yes stop_codon:yes gene_type:complete
MNILFQSHSNGFTGSDLSLREIIFYCKANDYNVFLCIPYNVDKTYVESLGLKNNNILFMKPMIWHKIKSPNYFRKFLQIAYIIFKTKGGFFYTVPKLIYFLKVNKINVVHSNSFVLLEGAIASKILNIPHIQHIRELLNKENSPFEFPFQSKSKFFKKLMNSLHRKIIFNSSISYSSVKKLFPKEKSLIIPNSFPDEFYKNSIERKTI